MAIIQIPKKKKMIKLDEDFDFGSADLGLDDEVSTEIIKASEETMIPQVQEWLKKHGLDMDKVQLETTGGQGIAVDVLSNLTLSGYKYMHLPDYFFFRYVKGNCNFSNNLFTDWRHFPQHIGGDCLANFNKIISFDGAPVVDGYMAADRQRTRTLYKLNDENYRKYRNGVNLTESLVFVPKENDYGYLKGISENKKTCVVRLHSGKNIKTLCEDVELVDGFKYLKTICSHLIS